MRAACWLPLMSILVVTHRVSPTGPAAGGAVLMQAARPQRQELSPGSQAPSSCCRTLLSCLLTASLKREAQEFQL